MTDSENIDLQKRARRRLVGAAALALIAAIVLPMIMEDEPGFPVQEIQVSIPDRDAYSTLARPIGNRPTETQDRDFVPAPQEVASDEADAPTEEVITPRVAPPPQPPQPAQTPASPDKPPADAIVAPARASAPPAPAPESSDEAARVKAILDGKLVSSARPASTGGTFVVQVGAFGEPTKATSLSSDLNRRGFTSYTERAGPVTRVRVGPFASKEEADRAAERLRALNMSAVVTAR